MKEKFFITFLIVLFGGMNITAQNNVFEKLSNTKDISTVFISKSLLNMMPSVDMGGKNIKVLSDKLEQMEIYKGSDKSARKAMNSEIKNLSKDKLYENLMTVKEDKKQVIFYAQKDKENFKDLVMYINKADESVIIRIIGDFTAKDIQDVIDKN